MPLPRIGNEWSVRGELPSADVQVVTEAQLRDFDEDLVQLVHRSGAFVLDVGWLPSGSRNGRFVCRAIADDDWDSPLDELQTRQVAEVQRWLEGWFTDVAERIGEAETIIERPARLEVVPEQVYQVHPTVIDGQDAGAMPITDVASSSGAVRSRMPEYAT